MWGVEGILCAGAPVLWIPDVQMLTHRLEDDRREVMWGVEGILCAGALVCDDCKAYGFLFVDPRCADADASPRG